MTESRINVAIGLDTETVIDTDSEGGIVSIAGSEIALSGTRRGRSARLTFFGGACITPRGMG